MTQPATSTSPIASPAETASRAQDFDFGDWIYLNCSYQGPPPRLVEEALDAVSELRRNPARMITDYYFSFPDAYRRSVGELIGADPSNVAVTTSCTSGLTLVANGLDWRSGDELVIPAGEFPSNRLPWMHLERRGVTVRQVALGDDDPVAALEAAFTRRTRLLSLSWVGFSDGRRIDLGRVAELCRAHGVLFAVDASQGVGGLHFDLRETPCDLLASVGYKYLLGPYGLGFAYVEPSLADRLELANVNWISMRGAEDFTRLASLGYDFTGGPRRFDANNTASFYNVAAGTAAVRYLLAIGTRQIERHRRALQDHALANLPAGFTPAEVSLSEPRSNIFCIAGPDTETTTRAIALLRSRKISVSAREQYLRVSPHVYNTREEIDALLTTLADAADGVAPPATGAEDAQGEALHRRFVDLLGIQPHVP